MRTYEQDQIKGAPGIECLEVLISGNPLSDGNQSLFRTLSLYSLHNHPLQGNRLAQDSGIFHFMAFDWERTIKSLLEMRKVRFTVLRYFSTNSVCRESPAGDVAVTA